MIRSGRRFVGPTAELEEHLDPDDPTAPAETVIVLAERYRKLTTLRGAMEVGRSFLERPMVAGVAPLSRIDADAGRYTYVTGEVWSLAELLQDARRRGRPLGHRAAIELGWLVGTALVEAAEAGDTAGVVCHGDLSPWRIVLRPDGEVLIIGYGMPDPEWLRMRHTGADRPLEASFRYAPPERAAGRPEDIRSDLYSLALVVAEVACGEPVYAGTAVEAWTAARTGFARTAPVLGRLPVELREHLLRMLELAPATRAAPDAWCSGWAYLAADAPDGPSLPELATDQAQNQDRRDLRPAAQPLQEAHPTRMHQLASLLENLRTEGEPTASPGAPRPRIAAAAAGGRLGKGPTPDATPRRVELVPPPTAKVARTPGAMPAPEAPTPEVAEPTRPRTHATPLQGRAGADPRRADLTASTTKPVSDLPKRAEPARPVTDTPRRAEPTATTPRPEADKPRRADATATTPHPEADKPRRADATATTPHPEADKPRRAEPTATTPRPEPDTPRRAEPTATTPHPGANTPLRAEATASRPAASTPERAEPTATTPKPAVDARAAAAGDKPQRAEPTAQRPVADPRVAPAPLAGDTPQRAAPPAPRPGADTPQRSEPTATAPRTTADTRAAATPAGDTPQRVPTAATTPRPAADTPQRAPAAAPAGDTPQRAEPTATAPRPVADTPQRAATPPAAATPQQAAATTTPRPPADPPQRAAAAPPAATTPQQAAATTTPRLAADTPQRAATAPAGATPQPVAPRPPADTPQRAAPATPRTEAPRPAEPAPPAEDRPRRADAPRPVVPPPPPPVVQRPAEPARTDTPRRAEPDAPRRPAGLASPPPFLRPNKPSDDKP